MIIKFNCLLCRNYVVLDWQAVELDSTVLGVARDYFGLTEDKRLKVSRTFTLLRSPFVFAKLWKSTRYRKVKSLFYHVLFRPTSKLLD